LGGFTPEEMAAKRVSGIEAIQQGGQRATTDINRILAQSGFTGGGIAGKVAADVIADRQIGGGAALESSLRAGSEAQQRFALGAAPAATQAQFGTGAFGTSLGRSTSFGTTGSVTRKRAQASGFGKGGGFSAGL
jgi:hypothetical protein